jgi:hypothetical protein
MSLTYQQFKGWQAINMNLAILKCSQNKQFLLKKVIEE